MSGSHYIKMTA